MKENPSRPASIKVVETSPSDALVIAPQRGRGLVHKQNDDAEDKGFFGKRKRKSGPTEEHIKRLVFENLDAFPSNEDPHAAWCIFVVDHGGARSNDSSLGTCGSACQHPNGTGQSHGGERQLSFCPCF